MSDKFTNPYLQLLPMPVQSFSPSRSLPALSPQAQPGTRLSSRRSKFPHSQLAQPTEPKLLPKPAWELSTTDWSTSVWPSWTSPRPSSGHNNMRVQTPDQSALVAGLRCRVTQLQEQLATLTEGVRTERQGRLRAERLHALQRTVEKQRVELLGASETNEIFDEEVCAAKCAADSHPEGTPLSPPLTPSHPPPAPPSWVVLEGMRG